MKTITHHYSLLLGLLLLSAHLVHGQGISGPTQVVPGTTASYSYTGAPMPHLGETYTWSATGGSFSGCTGNYCLSKDITWMNSGVITLVVDNWVAGPVTYTLNVNLASHPEANVTVTNNCGSSTLLRDNPPSGYTYYWQSSYGGTSTANSSSFVVRSSGSTYYIRTRRDSDGNWWPFSKTISYAIKEVPATPAAPSVANNCGNSVLTRSNPPSGETWFWQSSPGGTSTSNANASVTKTSGSTYYLRARHNTTHCWSAARTVSYSIKPFPNSYSVTGSDSYCSGGNGVSIGLSDSQTGVNYQLKRGSTSVGSVMAGTGNALNFGNQTTAGTYTVIATNATTGCAKTMSGSRSVTVHSLPTSYNMTGGGSYCSGGNGVSVGLSDSQTGVNYQLKRGSTNIGSTVDGTGNALSFGNQAAAGTYTVIATNATTGCTRTMSGTASVSVNDLPTVNAGTDMTIFQTNNITLSGASPLGGSWSGQYVSGATFNGTSASLGTHVVTYSYTNSNGCSDTDTRVITVQPVPVVTLAGQTKLAVGQTATLSVVQGLGLYQWKKDGQNIAGANAHSYQVSAPGAYKVVITNSSGYTAETSSTSFERIYASDKNYVLTWRMKKAGIVENAIPEDVAEVERQVVYFDGLGRALQTVNAQASPSGKDIIQPLEYDENGRASKQYLPYSRQAGGLYENNYGLIYALYPILSSQYKFYQTADKVAHDPAPFSETVYEASPLNRPVKEFGPGHDWRQQDHHIGYDYGTNDFSDAVKYWTLSSGLPTSSSYYAQGELYRTTTTNEDGHQVREFTDREGRVILKQVETGEGPRCPPGITSITECDFSRNPWAMTYYVYDDLGNLRFVLPPEIFNGDETLDAGELDNYGFQYVYDRDQRLIEKKVPGAEVVYLVYDNRDRLVLTQDGEQRNHNQWLFTKYDALDRPIATGLTAISGTIQQVRDAVAASGNYYETAGTDRHGYTNNSYPITAPESDYLTVSYYDDYTFPYATSYPFVAELGNVNYFDKVKGQVTGTKTKILNSNEWLESVTYYDDRYRVIQSQTQTLKGIDRVTNQYDFTGKITETKTTHNDFVIVRTFEYDHADRLTDTWHELIDNGTSHGRVLLANNDYNELGELIEKNLHSGDGTAFHQSVDYRYNIRGWLTSINNAQLDGTVANNDDTGQPTDHWGMELGYNNSLSGITASPAYNGNISAVKWSDKLGAGQRSYAYTYDPMNRLEGADHQVLGIANATSFDVSIGDSVTSGYDLNGNIRTLTRKGKTGADMDALAYTYDGNQLLHVSDAGNNNEGFRDGTNPGNDYLYDDNGNMTRDLNKDITDITYNHLNLPEMVEKSDGEWIRYTYDAAGAKLSQEVHKSVQLTYSDFSVNNDGWGMSQMKYHANQDGIFGEDDVLKAYANNVNGGHAIFKTFPEIPGNRVLVKARIYLPSSNTNVNGIQMKVGQHFDPEIIETKDQWVSKEFLLTEDNNNNVINFHMISGGNLTFTGVNNPNDDLFYIKDIEVRVITATKKTDYIGEFIYENNTLQLIQHEEGRIVLDAAIGNFEYEYYLKDHLGNNRVVFTTKPKTIEFTANYENNQTVPDDLGLFEETGNVISSDVFDHTDQAGNTYTHTQRLTGADGQRIGSVIALPVGMGDTISVETFAKYYDPAGNSSNGAVPALATSLIGAFTGSTGATNELGNQSISNNFGSGSLIGTAGFPTDNTAPMAFLNLMFLPDGELITFEKDVSFAYDQIDPGAIQPQSAVKAPHDRLAIDDFISPVNGYVVVYLSNESDVFTEVYFDDLRVTVNEHPVVQTADYYPFGLTHSGGYQRVTAKKNDFKYQGKELQTDLDLGTYDFHARMYDPTLGRSWQTDPASDLYLSLSPYSWVANNPLKFIDPTGMFLDDYDIYADGTIVKKETDASSDTFTYIDEDGTRHEVGTYEKNDKGLIQLSNIDDTDGSGAKISTKEGNEDRLYASGSAVASLIGASADSGEEIFVVSASESDGSSPSPSKSHKDGKNMDIRYSGKDGSRDAINYKGSKSNFDKIDQDASSKMNASLKKFGYKDIRSSTLTITNTTTQNGKEVTTTSSYSVKGTTNLKNHYDHQHLQGYRPNVQVRPQAPKLLQRIGIQPLR